VDIRFLDHAAIFLLIAGTFTAIHGVVFRVQKLQHQRRGRSGQDGRPARGACRASY
jgi:hypothetical protein